jgi:hypothetical protein
MSLKKDMKLSLYVKGSGAAAVRKSAARKNFAYYLIQNLKL